MANVCVFCGTTTAKITNEHVFADWISEPFRHEPVGTAEMVESDGSTRAFPAVPFQQKVRVVCKPCNEGWMSSLEDFTLPGPWFVRRSQSLSTTTTSRWVISPKRIPCASPALRRS